MSSRGPSSQRKIPRVVNSKQIDFRVYFTIAFVGETRVRVAEAVASIVKNGGPPVVVYRVRS